ncbi:MAG: 1-acyl-sn-glycerol-3-phosphate acyltransferase [Saprospiraceae bacterium]
MRNIFSIADVVPNMSKWKVKIVDFILNNMPVLMIGRANKIGRKYSHCKDVEFAEATMRETGLKIDLIGKEYLSKTGAITIVANHPGGADVLATAVALGRERKDFAILANKLICFYLVEGIIIPVDTMSKKKVDISEIDKAYQEGKIVVFYAAGKNSRYNKEGLLRDRRWRTTFLDFARKYNTPIHIMKIEGANSPLFYKVSNFRAKYSWLKNVPLENFFQIREILTANGLLKMFLSKPINLKNSEHKETKQEKRVIADKLYNFLYAMNSDKLDFEQYEESLKSRANIR